MGILDYFRPKWKDPNMKVRLNAVGELTDQSVLAYIVRNDEVRHIRLAAIEKLEDQDVLESLAINGSEEAIDGVEWEVLMAVTKKIKDQSILANVVKYAINEDIREAAIRMLEDQSVLAYIVRNDEDRHIRLAAIEKLEDQSILVDIAKDAKHEDVIKAAFDKLKDQSMLADIAKNNDNLNIRLIAIEKLNDQSILVDIAKNAKDENIREKAVETLQDETALEDLAKNAQYDDVRKAAVKLLKGQSTGTCDQCNNTIKKKEGYLFYSSASVGMSGMLQETGNMFLCESCTNEIVSDKEYAKEVPQQSELSGEDILDNPLVMLNNIREVNASGIVKMCKSHGFTPSQAKAKARELALFWWKDNHKGQLESASFWKSGRKYLSKVDIKKKQFSADELYKLIKKCIRFEGNDQTPFQLTQEYQLGITVQFTQLYLLRMNPLQRNQVMSIMCNLVKHNKSITQIEFTDLMLNLNASIIDSSKSYEEKIMVLLDETLPDAPHNNWYRSPNVPPKKLKKAIKYYAQQLDISQVIALADGSQSWSADKGCILTTKALFYNNNKGSGNFKWNEILFASVGQASGISRCLPYEIELVVKKGDSIKIEYGGFPEIHELLIKFFNQIAFLNEKKA